MKDSSAKVQSSGVEIMFDAKNAFDGAVRVVVARSARERPPIEPLTDEELRSIAFADADGWRCFYPVSRGHLTAAEARAVMRAERGLPAETVEEREAAEFLLVAESGWADEARGA